MPAFGRESRILASRDFDRVMRSGRRAQGRNLILFLANGGTDRPRLGLAVGRKVGNAACRNRWKRLVRTAFRLSLLERLPAVDLVVVVKAAPPPASAPGGDRARRGTAPRERRVAPGLAAVEREMRDVLGRLEAFAAPRGPDSR